MPARRGERRATSPRGGGRAHAAPRHSRTHRRSSATGRTGARASSRLQRFQGRRGAEADWSLHLEYRQFVFLAEVTGPIHWLLVLQELGQLTLAIVDCNKSRIINS